MVPCAQGRVIVETARPAPPHFATCSTYRRPLVGSTANDVASIVAASTLPCFQPSEHLASGGPFKGAISKNAIAAQSVASRPEDLGVTPWYFEDYPGIDGSPGPMGERGSYPAYYAEMAGKLDFTSTRNSSIDSEIPRPPCASALPRKAYMDLRDAIALLDETCPNQEPSPSLTPRTPRTPLTPYPRNKRARSKSSDNSSSYSNDRLSDRSFEATRVQEKERKRPFLKKIGISKTEDKPFLAKLAPKIIGKPYLEKIGPSKAVERPFLDKIGSSKTLDKFIFETPRYERRGAARSEAEKAQVKEEFVRSVPEPIKEDKEKVDVVRITETKFATERRRSGKGYLLKMYSFETEDLESTVQMKEHRDPLRGASLDDVLDSGPSSLPPLEGTEDQAIKPELETRPTSMAELLKCRVTTSEEIIYTSASSRSPRGANSWGNSPRAKFRSKNDTSTPMTPVRHKNAQNSCDADESTPNSPMKRPISNTSPERQDSSSSAATMDRSLYSPTKTRRQTFEDILERNGKDELESKSSKQAQFERRGISSDNLLTKDSRLYATIGHRAKEHVEGTREASSEDSLAIGRKTQEYTKETFKQLQDKFKFHEIPTETYADFKRRTRSNLQSTITRQHDRIKANVISTDVREDSSKDSPLKKEEPSKVLISAGSAKSEEDSSDTTRSRSSSTVRSVLKKQEGVDHTSDQESDTNASVRRPKRRIFHEPSQETMDLLTELRRVKSLLKTPSWEKDLELDKKPARMPKRILLTDKEFCLSVERENSIRRPSRVIESLEKTNEEVPALNGDRKPRRENGLQEDVGVSSAKISGPALFEKKCLSLDYVDDDKPQKPETRAISLASTRHLPSEAEETINYSDLVLMSDSKSYSSDVFHSPTKETNDVARNVELVKDVPKKANRNHCAEVDIAIPIDQKVRSPKESMQVHGRTSDLYEIISPRSTPFRVKKRLGKISIEETVKPESFTLGSKVDCRSAVSQKRTKCFPL